MHVFRFKIKIDFTLLEFSKLLYSLINTIILKYLILKFSL